jgi:WD40 repeat protein
VTCIAAAGTLIAIGYTSGTVLVYNLEETVENLTVMTVANFEQVHSFSFHRSAVTCMVFSDENTRLISGSADTYIILYDLITSTAEFKLMGHSEPIT